MAPLAPGEPAPPIDDRPSDGPRMLFFYKVTCPTCQLSAPVADRLRRAFPDRFVGIGQDPPDKLESFARRFGASFDSISDAPSYEVSDAYGIRTVPTLFIVDRDTVIETAESWDRDAWNRVAMRMGQLVGAEVEPVSSEGDGLPPFRPG